MRYSGSDDSSSPGLEVKVGKMYMRRTLRLNPTRTHERALAVFTHVHFYKVLDKCVLVFLFIGWNMLCIQLAVAAPSQAALHTFFFFFFFGLSSSSSEPPESFD
jgi:hypothetical protein